MVLLVKKLLKKRSNYIKFTPAEQLTFLKRLHRLLKRGYPLNEALQVISWDKRMKQPSTIIYDSLFSGKYLDEALSKAKFHKLIVMYVYFVRINGDLLSSLSKSIYMFEQRIISIQKFKRVSRYPLFLMVIFIFLLMLIKQFILPSYIEMFQMHANSVKTVEWTLFLFNFFFSALLFITITVIVLFIFWNYNKRNLPVEKQLQIYYYIPIYREYVRMQTSFYFATHVSLLLKTGMSIKNIIEHMEKQRELPIIRHYASIMMGHLSKGYYLDELLQTLPFIDPRLANIFQKHHNKEELEKDLATYADFIAENLEQKTKKIIMYIQPTTFAFLGIFIIIIYFSLLWPMFQLIESI